MAEDEEMAVVPPTDSETTCMICYAEFLDAEDLEVHKNQVHPSGINQCHFCSSLFASAEDYAKHLFQKHALNLRCCQFCSKIFDGCDTMRKHEKKHRGLRKNRLSCSQCTSVFNNKYDLQQHEQKNHNNQEDGFFLSEYLPLLSSFLNIKAISFITSLNSSKTVYICTLCTFTATEIVVYMKHLESEQCRSIVCDGCCNVYKDKKSLVRHMINHKECTVSHSSELVTKACIKCYEDIDAIIYKEHVQNCKPIKCNLCNLVVKTINELTEHQTKEHPMAISMKICQFCHKECVGTVSLQKHIDRVHKGQFHLYKYTCIYCENTILFKHPKQLFAHFYSKHSDLQPYCCKICNLTFRPRKKFTIHIKLVHNSVGFVEFDERYHVFFTDKKSENPFQPVSFFANETEEEQKVTNTELQATDLQTDAPTDAPTDCPTDCPTDVPTDIPTDVESTPRISKPPKIRFKEEEKSKGSKHIKTDMSASEANQTDYEDKGRKTIKRKIKTRGMTKKKIKTEAMSEPNNDSDISDNEPLLTIRKRKKGTNLIGRPKKYKDNRRSLTCSQCQKYCYTFQNYKHHMSLHSKNDIKRCIKCSEKFNSKAALNKHLSEKHSSSKLTETLKNILERRKSGKLSAPELTSNEKFRKTIKRVNAATCQGAASIKEVCDKQSVKNFIENFMPEENVKRNTNIQPTISITELKYKVNKPPAIKMTKFKPKPYPLKCKLSMPVRYKDTNTIKTKVNVKLVHQPVEYEQYDYDQGNEYVDVYEEEVGEKTEPVPEVAQEVMLEESQEQPKPAVMVPHRIIIPELPKDSKSVVRIAHLLPEAPYYKIVKINDVLKPNKEKAEVKQSPENVEFKPEAINLPGGTKLVNVNPLAHLLGDTPIEKVVSTSKYYKYKSKSSDPQTAIAKALMKLEEKRAQALKKKTKKSERQQLPENGQKQIEE